MKILVLLSALLLGGCLADGSVSYNVEKELCLHKIYNTPQVSELKVYKEIIDGGFKCTVELKK